MKPAPPHAAAALPPARFAELFLQALSAGQETPAATPGGSARLVRGPHERALFTLRARAGDEAEYRAASRRFLALMRLLEGDDVAGLAHAPGGGSTLLHPALLDTAARMPLTRNGSFPPRRFREAAEAAARDDYAALSWPPQPEGTTS